MKTFIAAALFLLAACGAYDDGFDESDALGTVEQAITIQKQATPAAEVNPLWGGFLGDASPNDSTCQQVMGDDAICYHPSTKSIRIKCTDPTISASLDAVIASANSQLGSSGWSFVHTSVAPTHVEFVASNVTLSSTVNDNIDKYSDTSPIAVGGALSEPVSIKGVHKVWATALVRINLTKIQARGASASQDQVLLDHAVAHEFLKLVDVGARPQITAGSSTFASERLILPLTSTKTLFTAGEKCRAKAYSLSPSGTANLSTSANCSN